MGTDLFSASNFSTASLSGRLQYFVFRSSSSALGNADDAIAYTCGRPSCLHGFCEQPFIQFNDDSSDVCLSYSAQFALELRRQFTTG